MGQVVIRRDQGCTRVLRLGVRLGRIEFGYRWSIVVMSAVLDAPGRPDFAEGAESDNSTAPRVGRALSSRVYVPACAIAAAAAVLVALGWWQHWGGGGFASSVTSLRVVLVGPLSLVI